MSFDCTNCLYTLEPGKEVVVTAILLNGSDAGAQIIVAHPNSPNSKPVVVWQCKVSDELPGKYHYEAAVSNISPRVIDFHIQGGSLA